MVNLDLVETIFWIFNLKRKEDSKFLDPFLQRSGRIVLGGLDGEDPAALQFSQVQLINLKIILLFENVLKWNFCMFLAWTILRSMHQKDPLLYRQRHTLTIELKIFAIWGKMHKIISNNMQKKKIKPPKKIWEAKALFKKLGKTLHTYEYINIPIRAVSLISWG